MFTEAKTMDVFGPASTEGLEVGRGLRVSGGERRAIEDTEARARVRSVLECGCTPMRRIGLEVESVLLTREGRRIPFHGAPDSATALLERFGGAMRGRDVFEEGALVGLRSDLGELSVEPGSQFEWASPASSSVEELLESMTSWTSLRDRVFGEAGVTMTDEALDPDRDCSDSWVPKTRYRLMRSKYQDLGDRAWTPMQRTASVHLSFDYASEEDWRRKWHAVLGAMPASMAAFANSPGRWGGDRFASVRPIIWEAFDPERTRLPACAFDPGFDFDGYASWAASISRIAPDHTLDDDARAKRRLAEVFTPVRTKQVIEIRANDRIPDRDLPALVGFWVGILYDEGAVDAVENSSSWHSDREAWEARFQRACREGRRPTGSLRTSVRSMIVHAIRGLRRMESTMAGAATAREALMGYALRHGLLDGGCGPGPRTSSRQGGAA